MRDPGQTSGDVDLRQNLPMGQETKFCWLQACESQCLFEMCFEFVWLVLE